MSHPHSAEPLWLYNIYLLTQASQMIERLQKEATLSFDYAKAVGPHVRHVIEHYTAFLDGLSRAPDYRIEYDVRQRDIALQSQPDVTLAKIRALQSSMLEKTMGHNMALNINTPVQTMLQTGAVGEQVFTAPSSVGRELLFLSSHTVHHFALIAHYCKAAGVNLGDDFGKAPATVAFEHRQPKDLQTVCDAKPSQETLNPVTSKNLSF
jgi:hypothetical protein